jgi:hypothetical protein
MMEQHMSKAVETIGSKPSGQRQFLIVHDDLGRWIVVERHGLCGGSFTDRRAAYRFLREQNGCESYDLQIVAGAVEIPERGH